MKELPTRTKYYFEQFAHIGGAWNWNDLDVGRFRTFIHAAHQGRVKLTAPELIKLLLKWGFDDEDASELADLYKFGRDVLKDKPPFNYIGPKRIANR